MSSSCNGNSLLDVFPFVNFAKFEYIVILEKLRIF